MAWAYTLRNIRDSAGRTISEAWCRAWNATDPANLVLVETTYSTADGNAVFTALTDSVQIDISVIWGNNVQWYRNVHSSDGDDIDDAVDASHTQNTDNYAKGIRIGTSFPSTPSNGEMFFRTDLNQLYVWEA